jgi:hypothetical protein
MAETDRTEASERVEASTGNEESSAVELTTSERHTLLASEQRRRVGAVLAGRSEPIALAELVEQTLADDAGDGDAADETVDRLTAKLHHLHLPKMAECGVLDYDAEENVVTPRDDAIDSWRA